MCDMIIEIPAHRNTCALFMFCSAPVGGGSPVPYISIDRNPVCIFLQLWYTILKSNLKEGIL